ncbi:unnamed protein product, partial [Darwinula stevensoni]
MQSVCRWWYWVLYSFGLVLVVVGSILYSTAPKNFEKMVKKQLLSDTKTEAFRNWIEPPIPIYLQFYMFNVTNPDEFLYMGATPKLQQLGPYTYREILKTEVLEIYDNGTVEYFHTRTFHWDESMSSGKESDIIISLNAPVLLMAMKMAEMGFGALLESIIPLIEPLDEGKPFLRKSVAELLFQGYELTFMEIIYHFLIDEMNLPEDLVNQMFDSILPPEMSDGKFGYYRLNGTSDGNYLVGTGVNGPEDFADIKLWRGEPFHYKRPWRTDECNMINGTDGTIFPPFVDENSILYVFTPDLCRSVYITHEMEVEYQGIPGLRFIVDPDVIEDPAINLDNQCFCLSNGTCLKAGALDLSECLGVPLVMSMPHFYLGSEDYYNESIVEGLEPRKEWHQTFVDLEPVRIHTLSYLTGTILNASKKLQVNFKLRPVEHYPSFANVTEMLFPIFWMNESVTLPQEFADDLYTTIVMPQEAITIGSQVAFGIGLFTILQQSLDSKAEAFKNWIEPSIPIYLQFYVFNVTNLDKFLYEGATPNLQQLGPYTYREILKTEMLEIYDNGTAEYFHNRTYIFEDSMSEGKESDIITTLNTPVLTMVGLLEELNNPFFDAGFDLIIEAMETTDDGKPLLRKSVEELLIKGYELTFIDKLWDVLVHDLLLDEEFVNETFSDILPPEMADGIFGYYLGTDNMKMKIGREVLLPNEATFELDEAMQVVLTRRALNGTSDGVYLVGTGENGPEDFADIKLWQGEPFHYKEPWRTDECNMINGTDGTIFPPYVDENSILYVFTPDLCRSVYLTYEQDVELQGTPGLRFIVDPDVLEDPEINLANKCFCLSDGTCLKAGVLDLSECRDIPLVMSMPHFYLGSEEYFNESVVEGLEPRKEWHQTFVDLEP